MSELTGVTCGRPGCDGEITTSDYCNKCGHPAPEPATADTPLPPDSRQVQDSTQGRDPFGLPSFPSGLRLPDTPQILKNPSIRVADRTCVNCREPLTRPHTDREAALDGKCPSCGHPYSYRVKLHPGERVSHYTVRGALAHGGLGWVYAANNDNISDNCPVVLKGLLDAANPDAWKIAETEKWALATVKHPNIVNILDYTTHHGNNYIVMDYVRGVSLQRLCTGADGTPKPLPPADAIRYMLPLLSAFGYLHRRGLAYCDLKPENVMVTADNVVLVDMGGARRLDNRTSGFISTPGYRAPELDDDRFRPPEVAAGVPSVASDLFAVTRTLARLVLGRFPGFYHAHRHGAPPQRDHPLLVTYDSLDRLLRRGMSTYPEDRFRSAAEMADALLGVLHEIVARDEEVVRPLASRWFDAARHPTGEGVGAQPPPPAWEVLPDLRVDPDDPQAQALAVAPDEDPEKLVGRLAALTPVTRAVRLALARAHIRAAGSAADAAIRAKSAADAASSLDVVAAEDPREWRVDWYRGLLDLTTSSPAAAADAFDRVYSRVPGELPPRLALAVAAEAAGDKARAATLFDVVSTTDPAMTIAAFGLARCRVGVQDKIEAYGRVPRSSHAFTASRVQMIKILVRSGTEEVADEAALRNACGLLVDPLLDLGELRRAELRRDILMAALRLVMVRGTFDDGTQARRAGQSATAGENGAAGEKGAAGEDGGVPDITVLGHAMVERDLRFALENEYREMARLTRDRRQRTRLVNRANQVRPRTLL